MKHTVSEISLSNGAKGLLINVPDALVMTFEINFRAGEYLTDPRKWEVPHIMEHLALGANKLVPRARDFQAEIEKNGAYSNASTGVYDIIYEAECADFEWDRILELMLTAIAEPLFLEDEFEAEYGNVQEELVARSNNHYRTLSLEMRKALGLITKTDAERLKLMPNVSVEDIRDHHKKTHFTSNMRFIIAGNLAGRRAKKVEELVSNIKLPKGSGRFILPDEAPRNLRKPVYIPNKTVENFYFYIDTFLNRRLTDEETDALGLANTIMTETLYSRILGTARERGLVYGMSSGISETKIASNLWFGSQVSQGHASDLFALIKKEVLEVRAGKIKPQEISAAKQYSLGRFQRSAQTVGGTAGGYAGRYFFDGVIDHYYEIPDRIKAVSKDGLVKIVDDLFSEKIWGMGMLGGKNPELVEQLHDDLKNLWK